MREIARRFNERFGPILVEPEHRIPEWARGSWTCRSRPARCRRPAAARRARSSSWTSRDRHQEDQERSHRLRSEIKRGDGKEGIANLIQIMAVAGGTTEDDVERESRAPGTATSRGRSPVAVVELLAPVRERYEELRRDEPALERTLSEGAEKARAIASGTICRGALGEWASARPSAGRKLGLTTHR